MGVDDRDLVDRGPVEVEQPEGDGRPSQALTDEQCVDLEGEERGNRVPLRRSLARLVVGDDQPPIGGFLHPVEDAANDDAVEVLEHVELTIERFHLGWILDREVVGEQRHRVHTPLSFLVDGREQPPVFLGVSDLGPGLSEERVEHLGGPLASR